MPLLSSDLNGISLYLVLLSRQRKSQVAGQKGEQLNTSRTKLLLAFPISCHVQRLYLCWTEFGLPNSQVSSVPDLREKVRWRLNILATQFIH